MQVANSKNSLMPWALVTIVSLLAIYVWASSLNWHFGTLSAYQFFPLLGLLAFSIMWSQYVSGFLRQHFFHDAKLDTYFRFTGYAVLVAIVLHPSILIYKRFRDGFGLPPHSYESYVMPSMAWITLLGTACLFIFLAFELHRWFSHKRWWKYVANTADFAMVGIFYHALELGTQTHIGWFRVIWYFYGLTLLIILMHKYLGFIFHKTATPTH